MGTFCFYHHDGPDVKGIRGKSSFRTHLREGLWQKFDHALSQGIAGHTGRKHNASVSQGSPAARITGEKPDCADPALRSRLCRASGTGIT